MTDRELLELAAKAAGMLVIGSAPKYIAQGCAEHALIVRNDRGGDSVFDPLTSDGDALRLAVKLDIDVFIQLVEGCTMASAKPEIDEIEPHGNDPYTATRRAITRAAAAIGASK